MALLTWAIAVVGLARSDFQFSNNDWTRIGYCNTRLYSRMDYNFSDVVAMAQRATRVKICTQGSTLDCITSSANSFPIAQLQAGRSVISRQVSGQCCRQRACISRTWSGPVERINEATYSCTSSCSSYRPFPPSIGIVYHGCGNAGGLHMTISNTTDLSRGYQCSWGASTGGYNAGLSALEVFIDYQLPTTTPPPTAPTSAPSMGPTGWWLAPELPDLNETYRRVQQLEQQILALNSEIVTNRSILMSTTTSLAVQVDDTIFSQAMLNQNVTAISNNVGAIVSSLRAAVQGATVGGGGNRAASVTSSANNDLALDTGATVRVSSGTCSSPDLCGAASFADALKQALATL